MRASIKKLSCLESKKPNPGISFSAGHDRKDYYSPDGARAFARTWALRGEPEAKILRKKYGVYLAGRLRTARGRELLRPRKDWIPGTNSARKCKN